jgi:hypothetical protein
LLRAGRDRCREQQKRACPELTDRHSELQVAEQGFWGGITLPQNPPARQAKP